MAILMCSNNIVDWSAGSIDTAGATHDTTRVPYSINVNQGDTATLKPHPAPSGDVVWYHFELHMSSNLGSGEDGYLCTFTDANGNFIARIDALNGDVGMQVSGDGTTWGATGTKAAGFSAGLQTVDVKVEVTVTDVTAELYVGGVLIGAPATIANSASLGVPRNFIMEPDDIVGGLARVKVSEVIVADTSTIGARLSMLRVSAAGNYSAWGGSVADLEDDDTVTGISSDTANERSSFTIDAYAGGSTITAVLAQATIVRGATGPQNARLFLRKGGVDYDGASQAPDQDVPGPLVEEWATDPADSLAWTSADLSGLEVGVMSLT